MIAAVWAGSAQAPAVAASSWSAPAEAIIQQARSDCAAFEDGVLTVPDSVVSQVDLTGDGQPDEVVDTRDLACSSAASLYCGTGGCTVVLVAGEIMHRMLVKDWRVIDWHDRPVVLAALHGSACGGSNLRYCVEALTWDDGGFHSVRPPIR